MGDFKAGSMSDEDGEEYRDRFLCLVLSALGAGSKG